MNSKANILAATLAIFLAGAVVGGVVGVNYGRRFLDASPNQAQIAQRIRSHLKDRAGLREEQLLEIDPIIQKTAAKLETERQDTMRKVWSIFVNFHAEIAGPAALTTEQKGKLVQIERDHLERLKPSPTP